MSSATSTQLPSATAVSAVTPTAPATSSAPNSSDAAAGDPISNFVAASRATGGLWVNGITPLPVKAPTTATIEEVVALVYDPRRYGRAHDHVVTKYSIREKREVDMDGDGKIDHTLLVIDSNLGERLLMLRPEKDGWYNREFAINK